MAVQIVRALVIFVFGLKGAKKTQTQIKAQKMRGSPSAHKETDSERQ
jgi:hypothetical protein